VRKLVAGAAVLAAACAFFWWNAHGRWRAVQFGRARFLVVAALSGDGIEASGYPAPAEGAGLAPRPGDVYVCGMEHGMVLLGLEMRHREIAVVEAAADGRARARLARPGERLAVRRPVEAFGGVVPSGVLVVPADSTLPVPGGAAGR
jgi:hypothetical protein